MNKPLVETKLTGDVQKFRTRRRVMKEFSIAEISGVDDPAQAPALMTLMKARDMGGKPPVSPAPGQKKEDDVSKTNEELQAELTKSADALKAAEAKTARLEAIVKMSDAEKAHFNGLSKKAQEDFLTKSDDERKQIVDGELAKAAEANPVVYKSKATGAEFRKNDDARLIDMAKRDDQREEEFAKMREEAVTASFEKRASTELAKFKGDLSTKGALLKAVAGIKDDAKRSAVEEMLKAAHGAVGLVLKEVGHTGGNNDADADDEDLAKSANAKLDELAKKYATDHKVSMEKAYDEVLKSAEGAALYAKAAG